MTTYIKMTEFVRPNGKAVTAHFPVDDEHAAQCQLVAKEFSYAYEALPGGSGVFYISDDVFGKDIVTRIVVGSRDEQMVMCGRIAAQFPLMTLAEMRDEILEVLGLTEADEDGYDDEAPF